MARGASTPDSIRFMTKKFGWDQPEHAQSYGQNLLASELVVLRETRDDDLPVLAGWWNCTPLAALQQRGIKPRPANSIEEMFMAWSQNAPLGGDAGFSITSAGDGTLLGHVTLFGGGLPHRGAELAIMLGPEHMGRGLGTAAVRLMVRYGFRELGLHRIHLKVAAFNTRAIRSYEKAGFSIDGRERDALFHDGRFHDHIIMSILEHEFAPELQPIRQIG